MGASRKGEVVRGLIKRCYPLAPMGISRRTPPALWVDLPPARRNQAAKDCGGRQACKLQVQ